MIAVLVVLLVILLIVVTGGFMYAQGCFDSKKKEGEGAAAGTG